MRNISARLLEPAHASFGRRFTGGASPRGALWIRRGYGTHERAATADPRHAIAAVGQQGLQDQLVHKPGSKIITLMTIGSRGDVQPLVAFGKVRLCCRGCLGAHAYVRDSNLQRPDGALHGVGESRQLCGLAPVERQGLRQEGHTVRIATHAEFGDWITGHGLEFRPLAGNPAELLVRDA